MVGRQQHADAVLAHQPPQQPQRLDAARQIEIRRRLVEDHQPGLLRQRASDQDALALAVGEAAHSTIGDRGGVDGRHHGLDALAIDLGQSSEPVGEGIASQSDQLARGERAGVDGLGEHDAEVARQPLRGARSHVLAEDLDAAGERTLHARDGAQQRRLTRAVGTQETDQLARFELEVGVVDQPQLAITAEVIPDRERPAVDQRRHPAAEYRRRRARITHTTTGAPRSAVMALSGSARDPPGSWVSTSANSASEAPRSAVPGTSTR